MVRERRPSDQTLAVLEMLAADPLAWSHGYALCQRLGLRAGTVYPILIRLADRGVVETTWESTSSRGRPPRHLYRLTALGVELTEDLRHPEAVPADPVVPVVGPVLARPSR